MTTTEPLLYRPEEAAKALGVCRATLFTLIGTGALGSVKIGHSRRIPRAALESYVAELTAHSNSNRH